MDDESALLQETAPDEEEREIAMASELTEEYDPDQEDATEEDIDEDPAAETDNDGTPLQEDAAETDVTPETETVTGYDTPEKNYESFFGQGTEEERLRIREIASKIGIRDNDALWLIVYILNYFGRFYQDLPGKIQTSADLSVATIRDRCAILADEEMQRVKQDLGAAVVQHAESIAKRREIYAVALPLAWLSAGIFCLCLLSFVSGAAVAGRGWGSSPFDSILAAPAGWILPIAMLPLTGYSLYLGWCGYQSTKRKKHLGVVLGALSALALAFACFLRTV